MIRVHAGSSQPIYLQIVDGMTRSMASGELRPDESLPSIRELAAELVVNPNTVVRAYGELVRLGLVVAQPGRGYVIIARRQVFTSDERQRQLAAPAHDLAVTTMRLGGTLADAQRALDAAWTDAAGKPEGKP